MHSKNVLRRVGPASPSWADWKPMFSVTLGWLHRHQSRDISYTGSEPQLRLRPSTTTFFMDWSILKDYTHDIPAISLDTLLDTSEKYCQPPHMPHMQEHHMDFFLLIPAFMLIFVEEELKNSSHNYVLKRQQLPFRLIVMI